MSDIKVVETIDGLEAAFLVSQRYKNCQIDSTSFFTDDNGRQQVKIRFYDGPSSHYMTYTLDGPFLLASTEYSHRQEFNPEAYENASIVSSRDQHSRDIFKEIKAASNGTKTHDIYRFVSDRLVPNQQDLENLCDYQPDDFMPAEDMEQHMFFFLDLWDKSGEYAWDVLRRSQEAGRWITDPVSDVPNEVKDRLLKSGYLQEVPGGVQLSKKAITTIAFYRMER
jgi:hypothetical protein